MKLVMLYGPPAVGKLTVAKALENMTDLKLLHNHLIADLVLSLFPRGALKTAQVNHKIRNVLHEAAAQEGMPGIITTFAYNVHHPDQMADAVRDMASTVAVYGAESFLVRLTCTPEALLERVGSASRQGTRKLTSVEILKEELKNKPHFGELTGIPFTTLSIDNTYLEPAEVARQIKEHCHI